jgi:tetratricopeptide (TPR) repeat protein
MSSIIEGYNYDIFISYRQKDNKYDGWVNEFIDHLKREIEATFKEEVSIYFDENPHDGLLEIHNVDKSLATKLKSLIFMPIISQTYCDPNSFAWQNEFVVFNKTASTDPIGRDVKLANGNVCSRIIPIKIHNLDASDSEFIENELGCRLRSIDFIYSSAGVNRPLKPSDDPAKNLNKSFYRDQINKVANTVKEIIYGLHPDEKKRITKTFTTTTPSGYAEEKFPKAVEENKLQRLLSLKFVVPLILILIMIILMIIYIPKLVNKAGKQIFYSEKSKKTIAVMPVLNFTGNTELIWIADMIQNDLTGQLQSINNLIVRPRQTTLQFRNSEESVQSIAQKLGADNLIESSIKGTEDNLTVEIRVVEAFPEERYLYSSSFSQSVEELTSIYTNILSHILKNLEVKATDQEIKTLSVRRKINPEVRRACARGLYHLNLLTVEDVELGIKYYKEAIALDPGDPEPYIGLAMAYGSAGHGAGILPDALQQSRAYALKAIELDPDETYPNIGDAHIVIAQKYFCYDYDFNKAIYHLKRGLQLNPNSPAVHYLNGWYLALINKIDEAADEMKKAIAIDPLNPQWTGNLAWMYQWTGRNEESLIYAEEALKINPGYPMALYVKGMVLSALGRHEEAIEIQKSIFNTGSRGYSSGLGVAYALEGNRDKALEVANELEKLNKRWLTYGLAEIYSVLKDNDKAIYWLEEAYRQKQDFVPWIRVNPNFDNLHGDKRYEDIIKRLNLPV